MNLLSEQVRRYKDNQEVEGRMNFRKVSLRLASANHWDVEKFANFRDEFGVEGYHWTGGGRPCMSASYFVALLQKGASARKYTGKGSAHAYYQHLGDFNRYSYPIFDHTMLWRLANGQVICTSMPYSEREQIQAKFAEMAKEFSFPASIKLRFLDDKYKYRLNGDFMLAIYDEAYRRLKSE